MESKIIHLLVAMFIITGLLPAVGQPAEAPSSPPVPKTIARILDRKIHELDKNKLREIIFGTLLDEFAEDNNISPAEEELDSFVRATAGAEERHREELDVERNKLREELRTDGLSDEERADKEARLRLLEDSDAIAQEPDDEAERAIAGHFVRIWKINKALHAKYGGRVIFQQAGFEPIDAYRDFLKEQERLGNFEIMDETVAAKFWRYFSDDSIHTFLTEENAAKAFATPWWMKDEPAEAP
jgi:hypothetical protein